MKKKETIFQLLTQKPWDPAQAKIDNMHDGETLDLSKGKLGLRYIMIVSSIFFSLFIVTLCVSINASNSNLLIQFSLLQSFIFYYLKIKSYLYIKFSIQ